MKGLRVLPRTRGARRRAVNVAAVAAGTIALSVAAAVPVAARGHHHEGENQGGDQGGGQFTESASVVNFRQNAIFSCFTGSDNTGFATANTAQITTGFASVTAVVTIHALPGTTVFGQLTQSGCARLKFFTLKIPASGVGTTTVSDLRVSNDAFVWFNDTSGDFQITPDVPL